MNSYLPGIIMLAGWLAQGESAESPLRLHGSAVIPHVQSTEMRYRREVDRSLGARTQLFFINDGTSSFRMNSETRVTLRGKTPDELLSGDEWAWHDFPGAWTNSPIDLPPGALTVWSFNGKRSPWGVGTSAEMIIADPTNRLNRLDIDSPTAWLSSVTFLGDATNPFPNSVIFHIANRRDSPLHLEGCTLWLATSNSSGRVFRPHLTTTNFPSFPADGVIPAGENGGARLVTGPLPLTDAVLEVRLVPSNGNKVHLLARVRIKREAFDLGGGWVNSTVQGKSALTYEPFLKTLRRMHINTGMHDSVPGYTDNAELYAKFPLKYMNRCQPFDRYDTDAVLPRIHAVEFLGEPQYGGGRPVPPMEVWRAFAPYKGSRLPTSVTHSEERIWRFYAGLSDYPHYDAYRVSAPAPDAWMLYDRWGDEKIRWGAPLETIGDMTRSLRDLNRPAPIAYWSQGAHDGWGRSGGRDRTSPTPDELRAQAYHALAHHITSLYWFNLSLKSVVKFPDLIDPITRVNREIRLLEDYYLEGDAYRYERVVREGKPDWDLAVVAGPRGAVLFALDLAYIPDPKEKVFKFGPPRDVMFEWPVPSYLNGAKTLLRVDADSISPVEFERKGGRLSLPTRGGAVNIFVLPFDNNGAGRLQSRLRELVAFEDAFDFDPARRGADLQTLRAPLGVNP